MIPKALNEKENVQGSRLEKNPLLRDTTQIWSFLSRHVWIVPINFAHSIFFENPQVASSILIKKLF